MNKIEGRENSRKALFSWAMYDWANSAFFAVIQTFVFAWYFVTYVATDEITGTTQWGNTIGLAGLVIALIGPALGAIADQRGGRKPWILVFSLLCIISTGMMWFVAPSNDFLVLALVLLFLGVVGSEVAIIFYNAMLPTLADNRTLGRWSGWAWGLGFAGGLTCLVIARYYFIEFEGPLLGLDTGQWEHVRATFVWVAVWYLLFAIPLFMFTPDQDRKSVTIASSIRQGWEQLRISVKNIREYRSIVRFLIARMFFIDGLNTVFTFGGIYAAGTFGMTDSDVLMFGIGLNVTAGIGAAVFAWIDDLAGSKKTILVSLVGLIVTVSIALLVNNVFWFWVFGMSLGIFVGPAQAASRTYMARIAPEKLRNEMFGLFALSGKVTSFMGPVLVGWITFWTSSQRIGMSIIVLFLVIGISLMFGVPDIRSSGEVLENEKK